MGTYLASNKIQVFPISRSRPDFPYARTLTEDHILDLIRSVAPTKSFVVSDTFNGRSLFEFIINGYYVALEGSDLSQITFTGKDVYAHIFIDTTSPTHPQLWGEDNGDIFKSVYFSDSAIAESPSIISENCEHYYLHILTKVTDTNGSIFVVPIESRKTIDGGEIQ